MRSTHLLVLVVAAALLPGSVLRADAFFTDNFNTSSGSPNINFQYNLGRQSGGAAPLTYTERTDTASGGAYDTRTYVNHAQNPGALSLWPASASPDYVWVSPQHNFIESGSFEISIDVDPVAPGSLYNSGSAQWWASVVLGTASQGQQPIATDGIGIFVRNNGGIRLYSNSVDLGEAQAPAHSGYYRVRIVVSAPGFNGSCPAYISVFVDGVNYFNLIRDTGFTANYITFGGIAYTTSTAHAFDNLSVGSNPQPVEQALFADNCNASSPSDDINFEYNLGRQSGIIGNVAYVERPDTASGGSSDAETSISQAQTILLAPDSSGDFVWASPDHNFVDGDDIRFAVDIDPDAASGGTSSSCAGMAFGASSTGQRASQTDGVGLELSDDGALRVFDNGVDLYGELQVPSHEGLYRVEVEIGADGFGSGRAATVGISLDGVQFVSYTREIGLANNYITFSCESDGTGAASAFDNLNVMASSVATPVFTPDGGMSSDPRTVVMTTATPDAVIRYTTNGGDPNSSSTQYTSPLLISTNTTLKARAFKSGWLDSNTKSATYAFVSAVTSIMDAKARQENSDVACAGKIVTAQFDDHIYIEEPDRSSAIRVNWTDPTIARGHRVDAAGRIKTTSEGERYIDATSVSIVGQGTVDPVGMSNCAVVGGSYNYVAGPPQSGQEGIAGLSGLNNVGMLIKVWGMVLYGTESRFTISDGSNGTVTVEMPEGLVAPTAGYYSVTGISSCEKPGGTLARLIKPRDANDLNLVWMPPMTWTDNFNVSSNSWDVNFEHNLGRQSGNLGIFTYSERSDTAQGGTYNSKTQVSHPSAVGTLTLLPGGNTGEWDYVCPDHSFTESGSFEISFDVDPMLTTGGTSTYWAAAVFGASAQGQPLRTTDGIGFLLQDNGDFQLWDNGVGGALIQGPAGHAGYYHVRITVDSPGFSGTGPVNISIFIDGINYLDYTRSAGFTGNYIEFGAESNGGTKIYTFDNVTFSTIGG